MQPVYLGDHRSMAQLSTGEFVCVDSASVDSIDYLLGFEMEIDVMRVFRRFLRPDSVVLDIGANFGLYTARASSFLGADGRLYGFEANPHTFQFYETTVYANRLKGDPRVQIVNKAVSDKVGKTILRFSKGELGGATVLNTTQWGEKQQRVEVDCITVDGFLPKGTIVDLAKIDVEGHEPAVLRGMVDTVKRSPNIRIIIEFFEHMTSRATNTREFVREVNAMGLHFCKIAPGGELKPLSPGQLPSGEGYYLLTRTPQADAKTSQQEIPLAALKYHDAYKALGNNHILKNGEVIYSAAVHGMIDETVLFFGPYMPLVAGNYDLLITGDIRGEAIVRLQYNFGYMIGEYAVRDNFEPIRFEIPADIEKFEVQLSRSSDLKRLNIKNIVLRKSADDLEVELSKLLSARA